MAKQIRAIVIVLDSAGVGALPDAGQYGDEGAATLPHLAQAVNGLRLPILQKMGLGNIAAIAGVPPEAEPAASWGKMAEASAGKDTVAGHWELMGLPLAKPFALFPNGFSAELISEFIQAAGLTGVLGNRAASGTVIIQELGAEHLATGRPIVYTSADSVFQIAAHEQVIPLNELYRICQTARRICDRLWIGRVIARPFIGQPGSFSRTANRRDFPMLPPADTVLDALQRNRVPVAAIGKIEDIFAGRGIDRSVHTHDNDDGMNRLEEELARTGYGLIFINLIDFDMLYGHRNDAAGYGRALEEFDSRLAELLPRLGDDDWLIIVADHGCDPTFPGTDHTREYAPLLAFNRRWPPGKPLGIRSTFADVAASLRDLFAVEESFPGKSFIKEVARDRV